MMHMEHRLTQAPQLRLKLTQKMQQAIQILQLSTLELEQHIQQELETNPVLEQLPQDEPELPESTKGDSDAVSDDAQLDDSQFDLDSYASSLGPGPTTGADFSRNADADARRQFYEDSITQEESFGSQLMSQLHMVAPDEEMQRIGERIIGDIDDKGYFAGALEDVASDLGISVERAADGLRLVQSLEPTGIGARDIIECLLLQIDVEYPGNEELKTLVTEHLEDLEHRQIPKIAKAMKTTPEHIEELKDLLSRLDPWPGLEYSSGAPQYVMPDVIVEEVDDEMTVRLRDDAAPRLHINDDYREMMKREKIQRKEKQYLRDKIESARWLIRNIEQRQDTILKIASAIVDVQQEFMRKGVEHIKPLTLQEIADVVGVHEATVSRTTRGKYMQTPQGLYEMKYFFSPGLRKDSGGEQSSKSVQSLIKRIIDEEDKSKPLSDQKIANKLKEQGINIARRTVSKYREGLGILPTNLRREYG